MNALLFALAALADTGDDLCKDWTVTPESVDTFSGNSHDFRIDTPRSCRSGLECSWSLTNEVGTLDTDAGLLVTWAAPDEYPPECDPLDTTLVATCVLWDGYTRTASADIRVRCTDEERERLAEERAAKLTVQGGGCTSPGPAEALLLLPFGLLGLRRRLRG